MEEAGSPLLVSKVTSILFPALGDPILDVIPDITSCPFFKPQFLELSVCTSQVKLSIGPP
jgi:hypothetical protein